MRNKNGIALNQAFGAILTLVLVATLVIIGIVLFVNLTTGPFANAAELSVTNEALTPTGNSTGTGVAVSNATLCSFDNFAIVTATNSSGSLIAAGNYSTTPAGLVINHTNLSDHTFPPWNINYTATWGSEACTASDNMITQFGTYPALIGLVGTIIFLGIVIGVLVASFVFGRRRDI